MKTFVYLSLTPLLLLGNIASADYANDQLQKAIQLRVESAIDDAISREVQFTNGVENTANKIIFSSMPDSSIIWQKDVDYVQSPRKSFVKADGKNYCKAMIESDENYMSSSYLCSSDSIVRSAAGSLWIMDDVAHALLKSIANNNQEFYKNTVAKLLSQEDWTRYLSSFDMKFNVDNGDDETTVTFFANKKGTKDYYNSVAQMEILKCSKNPNILDISGGEFDVASRSGQKSYAFGCHLENIERINNALANFRDQLEKAIK